MARQTKKNQKQNDCISLERLICGIDVLVYNRADAAAAAAAATTTAAAAYAAACADAFAAAKASGHRRDSFPYSPGARYQCERSNGNSHRGRRTDWADGRAPGRTGGRFVADERTGGVGGREKAGRRTGWAKGRARVLKCVTVSLIYARRRFIVLLWVICGIMVGCVRIYIPSAVARRRRQPPRTRARRRRYPDSLWMA